jgi:hypothetical protein
LEKYPSNLASSPRLSLPTSESFSGTLNSATGQKVHKKQRSSIVSPSSSSSFSGRASSSGGAFSPTEKSSLPSTHVHLRSSRLHPVKIGYSKPVEKILLDFGLSAKPLFATEKFCTMYDELRTLAVQQLDSKKKR